MHTYTCWPVPSASYNEPVEIRPENFRVIDIINDRIVPAPSNCNYVALSYVWGDTIQRTLNKADFRHEHRSDKILVEELVQLDRQSLARTIQDAMLVVETIGEQYLWVDSLCIVQDDENNLIENINRMDRIYSEATITIVAAGGDNADAGLVGLKPASRDIRPLEHVVEMTHLVETEPSLSLTLANTTWNKRAW
jgi:hypothetical protein